MAAGDTAQKHPILLELHQGIVSVKSAHDLSEAVDHATTAESLRVRRGRRHVLLRRDRVGVIGHHGLLLPRRAVVAPVRKTLTALPAVHVFKRRAGLILFRPVARAAHFGATKAEKPALTVRTVNR